MSGSPVRLAMATVGTLVVSLLGASIVDARPARPNAKHSQSTLCAAPPQVRASLPPPTHHRSSRTVRLPTRLVVHRHIMPKLQRDQIKRLVDDDGAISPAVSGHDSLLLLGALEPIGMLAVPPCQPTSHRIVLRRSPRGPPTSPV